MVLIAVYAASKSRCRITVYDIERVTGVSMRTLVRGIAEHAEFFTKRSQGASRIIEYGLTESGLRAARTIEAGPIEA